MSAPAMPTCRLEKLNPMNKCLVGEFFGSFFLAFFLHVSVALITVVPGVGNIWIICLLLAMIIAFLCYLNMGISGAYFNPAITVAYGLFFLLPKKRILPYLATQYSAWFIGSMACQFYLNDLIAAYEKMHNIVRGTVESAATGSIFYCITPPLGNAAAAGWTPEIMSNMMGVSAEVGATFIVALGICFCVDPRNPHMPPKWLQPLIIGMVVGFAVFIFAPISSGAINPARDFSPRVVAWLRGYGEAAFPGNPSGLGGAWWIYQVGPYLGAILGTLTYTKIMGGCFARVEPAPEKQDNQALPANTQIPAEVTC